MSIDSSIIRKEEKGTLEEVLARWQDELRFDPESKGLTLYFRNARAGIYVSASVLILNNLVYVLGDGVSMDGAFTREHRFVRSKHLDHVFKLCADGREYESVVSLDERYFDSAESTWDNPDCREGEE